MSKPVFLAGLLGGLLGAVLSFILARWLPAPVKEPLQQQQAASEARQFADEVIGKFQAGKDDEFFAAIRPGFREVPDDQFKKVRENILEVRKKLTKDYGARGSFEFSRETTLSPSVVRVSYVEKYERGCVGCYLVVYNSPQGWLVLAFNYQTLEAAFATLR